MITLRLDPKVEQLLNNTAKDLGLTKSELKQSPIMNDLSATSQSE